MSLPQGIYEALLDQRREDILAANPELCSVLAKLDPEEEPSRYAAFVGAVLAKALQSEPDSSIRRDLCNQIILRISEGRSTSFLSDRQLAAVDAQLLLEITPSNYAQSGIPRPETSLAISSLFTGSPADPQLVHELQEEIRSADRVDVLVSFIKWAGLRLLMPAFEELTQRGGTIRVVTTSYMGASDAAAVEWWARLPNTHIRVSYDTQRTRLHAKAYHFHRNTGFSTAYIGSSNMSQAAMTSGLEWNLKITAQDLPHILNKFTAEFETYWNSELFVPYDPDAPQFLRDAIRHARSHHVGPAVFFDLRPHPFQERILDALEAERNVHHQTRNLVVAATGTGKTVVAAFDFKRFFEKHQRKVRLLFVAHRREILEQAIAIFRAVLRVADYGELLVGPHAAERFDHLFCSVEMLNSRRVWDKVGPQFYDFIVVDEVHHGPAASYRNIFDKFSPQILLGLTATPERMDGASVAADFGNRFAAEIRLPEALEEKLLCPFHYFGVADPVSLGSDRFWKSGKYDVAELENVYTGDHATAMQRLEAVITALCRYEPDLDRVRGIGFCVSVKHAQYMADKFNERGIASATLVGETETEHRTQLMERFRAGDLRFLFTRDVLSEGVDVPEINTVLFLRPTESLTVFLQQLGRGLRHAPEKDALTVLDFVGQAHRLYRIDRKLKALLPKKRFNLEREVEMDFPHLPTGCSIQLDRVARGYVIANIRENLRNLADQIPERLETFEHETGQSLTFGRFVHHNDYDPEALLKQVTWSQWKARARLRPPPNDPDLTLLRQSLLRAAQTNGPAELRRNLDVLSALADNNVPDAVARAGESAIGFHYRLWGKSGRDVGVPTVQESFERLARNPSIISDLQEILAWSEDETRVSGGIPDLPFVCSLELHAQYGNDDIKAALGKATLMSAGERGVGLLHFPPPLRAYVLLITFQKTEREFSPTTMYADYPISRELLHWESQSNTSQLSETGQNLINHRERAYTILVFVRATKRQNGVTVPFTYLGPAERETYEHERPISIVWKLRSPMPASIFEENRRGG
jgi:superfamily II DNA or RNA helicase